MNTKEYAGSDLQEILEHFKSEGFTEVVEQDAAGFTAWQPFDDLPRDACVHVVVWPRAEGGYWCEEY